MPAARTRGPRVLWASAMARRLALICSVLAALAPTASAYAASDYENGLALGAKAYEYGVPLLDTARIYRTATSVNVPDGRGHGPVNRFSHARKLADATERTVN